LQTTLNIHFDLIQMRRFTTFNLQKRGDITHNPGWTWEHNEGSFTCMLISVC